MSRGLHRGKAQELLDALGNPAVAVALAEGGHLVMDRVALASRLGLSRTMLHNRLVTLQRRGLAHWAGRGRVVVHTEALAAQLGEPGAAQHRREGAVGSRAAHGGVVRALPATGTHGPERAAGAARGGEDGRAVLAAQAAEVAARAEAAAAAGDVAVAVELARAAAALARAATRSDRQGVEDAAVVPIYNAKSSRLRTERNATSAGLTRDKSRSQPLLSDTDGSSIQVNAREQNATSPPPPSPTDRDHRELPDFGDEPVGGWSGDDWVELIAPLQGACRARWGAEAPEPQPWLSEMAAVWPATWIASAVERLAGEITAGKGPANPWGVLNRAVSRPGVCRDRYLTPADETWIAEVYGPDEEPDEPDQAPRPASEPPADAADEATEEEEEAAAADPWAMPSLTGLLATADEIIDPATAARTSASPARHAGVLRRAGRSRDEARAELETRWPNRRHEIAAVLTTLWPAATSVAP